MIGWPRGTNLAGMTLIEASNVQASLTAKFQRPAGIRSEFDAALLMVLALEPRDGRDGLRDGRRAKMVTALDGRATYPAIRHWRHGTRQAPKWALDLLRSKLLKGAERQTGQAQRLHLALI